MSVFQFNMLLQPSNVCKQLLLSTALVSGIVLTGCASKPQINNTARYAVAPDFYTVRSGDTLSGIAVRYGLSYESVAAMNDIDAPYRIFVGQSLRLKNTGNKRTTTTQAVTQPAPIQRQSIALPSSVNNATTTTQTQSVTTNKAITPTNAVVTNPTGATSTSLRWVRPTAAVVSQKFDLSKNVKGVRFSGKTGDAILAAADGQVVYAADGLKEYGQLILVKHIDGYITAYAHNSKLLVMSGQNVTAGQKIAEMGNTGTTQTMLEFQVRLDGKPVDPSQVFPIN